MHCKRAILTVLLVVGLAWLGMVVLVWTPLCSAVVAVSQWGTVLGVPLCLAVTVVWFVVWVLVRVGFGRPSGKPFIILGGCLLFFLLAAWMVVSATEYRLDRACASAERVAQTLRQYYETYGRYPESLQEARNAGFEVSASDLSDREAGFYSAVDNGTQFRLRLYNPAAPYAITKYWEWIYFSETGDWGPEYRMQLGDMDPLAPLE